jgi:hypothetical protein
MGVCSLEKSTRTKSMIYTYTYSSLVCIYGVKEEHVVGMIDTFLHLEATKHFIFLSNPYSEISKKL